MDCSLPGFSVHGILQARILEWVAISFSRVQTFYPGLLSQALMKPSVQTFSGMRRGLRATLVRSAPHRGRRKKDGKWSQKVMLSPGQHISAGL